MCLLFSCAFFADLPLTQSGTRGVGIGGSPVSATIGGTGTLSIAGADWTGATTTIVTTASSVTSAGFRHGPASATSTSLAAGGVPGMHRK